MQEHLKDFTGDDISLEAKDQDEIEFHYFKLHDYDNNNKLGELYLGKLVTLCVIQKFQGLIFSWFAKFPQIIIFVGFFLF